MWFFRDNHGYAPPLPFKNPSSWKPPSTKLKHPSLVRTLDSIEHMTNKLIAKQQQTSIAGETHLIIKSHTNLTHQEQKSIKFLKQHPDIIIKNADKGGATVVMNKTAYIAEALRQLNNPKYYRPLAAPIYLDNVPIIREIFRDAARSGLINSKQLEYLTGPLQPRHRVFYILPKIHKASHTWPQPQLMPEGRPIVSDVNSESYRACEFIDYYINPLSTSHPSYIKNTYDFVNKIRNLPTHQDSFIVTGDVTALYTNMNIQRTLAVVRRRLAQTRVNGRPDQTIMKLLELILKCNDFNFNGQYYLQLYGTAMGRKFSPALANLYLVDFDRQATSYQNGPAPTNYFRYLDDVFFMWMGSEAQLLEFEAYLNTRIPGIRIKLEYHKTSMNFLDVTIFKHLQSPNTTLQTKVYFKPTDTHQLLHSNSFHPPHTTKGILKSQLIRFKRISSLKEDYDCTCKILFSHLKKRGYTMTHMRQSQKQIWFGHTDRALQPVTQDQATADRNSDRKLPIVVTYNAFGERMAKEYKSILKANTFFNKYKCITAYTNHQNLQSQIIRSQLQNSPPPSSTQSSSKCFHPNCKTCPHITQTRTFFNTSKNKTFQIKHNANCLSKNLIYLIKCACCGLQYVGETGRTLRERISDHRSCVLNKKPTSISAHFNSPGHSIRHLKVTPIELLPTNDVRERRARERLWQVELETIFPAGINALPIAHN